MPNAQAAVYSRRSFEIRRLRKTLDRVLNRQDGPAELLDTMAVRIRLKRTGAKNTPAYRIVVADGRSPRDGRFIEEIGSYLPLKRDGNVTLRLDRAEYWLSKGAQPSDTVASFIKQERKRAKAAQA